MSLRGIDGEGVSHVHHILWLNSCQLPTGTPLTKFRYGREMTLSVTDLKILVRSKAKQYIWEYTHMGASGIERFSEKLVHVLISSLLEIGRWGKWCHLSLIWVSWGQRQGFLLEEATFNHYSSLWWRSYQCPPYSCRNLVILVEWNLAGRPANFLIPVCSHSSGIWLFQNLHWNGPGNGVPQNGQESVYLFVMDNKQCLFGTHAHQTQPLFSSHHHLFFPPPPPTMLVTTTALCDCPWTPMTAVPPWPAKKWRWPPTNYNQHPPHEWQPGPTNGHEQWQAQVSQPAPPRPSFCSYRIQVPCCG